MEIKLSILICSLESRSVKLSTLLESLKAYSNQWYAEEAHDRDFYMCKLISSEVEIIYAVDNKQLPVGVKRNLLVKQASGAYVAFVDDDDMIRPDYIPELLEGIKHKPDVVTFNVAYFKNAQFDRPVYYSIKYNKDYHDTKAYYRLPNHLMCVKREHALATRFKAVNFGEDSDFARRLKPLLKTEYAIDKVLYSYLFDSVKTETQKK